MSKQFRKLTLTQDDLIKHPAVVKPQPTEESPNESSETKHPLEKVKISKPENIESPDITDDDDYDNDIGEDNEKPPGLPTSELPIDQDNENDHDGHGLDTVGVDMDDWYFAPHDYVWLKY